MEVQNVNFTKKQDERVSSTYAEIYFGDRSSIDSASEVYDIEPYRHESKYENEEDQWISPSDLLIGKIQLKPPFTSKITRGKAHKGILSIGNIVLENERSHFLKMLTDLLNNNNAAWEYILTHEKQKVIKNVKEIFKNIFKSKSEIMKVELINFYEKSLQDLDIYLKNEMQVMLQTAHSSTISDLNNQIHLKLKAERRKLENILQKKYVNEVKKMRKYYMLLLNNERKRYNKLLTKVIDERNEALRIFYKQFESQQITSTMYIMTVERKKCKVKKMRLDNIHTGILAEKLNEIKKRTEEIDSLKKEDVTISSLNIQWQNNVRNILNLFLKFISFTLKLLPDQTRFLLDLENMMTLQLQELQENKINTTILIDDKSQANIIKFQKSDKEIKDCENEPFVLYGDLSDPIPYKYGSRETIPSDVDLEYFRLQRQFVYAKCHGFENIKKMLDAQKCQCRVMPESSKKIIETADEKLKTPSSTIESESSFETLLVDEIPRIQECPTRKCNQWMESPSFPLLTSYVNYSEENYRRVTTLLEESTVQDTLPSPINPRTIAYREMPFSKTNESHHTIGTQCSSQEDITIPRPSCPCTEQLFFKHAGTSTRTYDESIESKRKISLEQMILENPKLLKLFTDECYDYKL